MKKYILIQIISFMVPFSSYASSIKARSIIDDHLYIGYESGAVIEIDMSNGSIVNVIREANNELKFSGQTDPFLRIIDIKSKQNYLVIVSKETTLGIDIYPIYIRNLKSSSSVPSELIYSGENAASTDYVKTDGYNLVLVLDNGFAKKFNFSTNSFSDIQIPDL